MEEIKKTGRPKKAPEPKTVTGREPADYEKVKIEIAGYKGGKPQIRETSVVKTVRLSKNDADLLNSQKLNSLIIYKPV